MQVVAYSVSRAYRRRRVIAVSKGRKSSIWRCTKSIDIAIVNGVTAGGKPLGCSDPESGRMPTTERGPKREVSTQSPSDRFDPLLSMAIPMTTSVLTTVGTTTSPASKIDGSPDVNCTPIDNGSKAHALAMANTHNSNNATAELRLARVFDKFFMRRAIDSD
jgi:hypothetical protein